MHTHTLTHIHKRMCVHVYMGSTSTSLEINPHPQANFIYTCVYPWSQAADRKDLEGYTQGSHTNSDSSDDNFTSIRNIYHSGGYSQSGGALVLSPILLRQSECLSQALALQQYRNEWNARHTSPSCCGSQGESTIPTSLPVRPLSHGTASAVVNIVEDRL